MFFGGGCNNNSDSWIWIVVIVALVILCCDGNIFGGSNKGAGISAPFLVQNKFYKKLIKNSSNPYVFVI